MRNTTTTHLGTLSFQPDFFGAIAAMVIQGFCKAVLVLLRRRLIWQSKPTKAAATVMGQPLQIHHCHVALS